MPPRITGIGRLKSLAIKTLIAGESVLKSMVHNGLGALMRSYLEGAFVVVLLSD